MTGDAHGKNIAPRRRVRLADLPAAERALVVALLEAAKAAQSTTTPATSAPPRASQES